MSWKIRLNEFAEGRSKTNVILKLEHFLGPCVLCDYVRLLEVI